MSSPNIVTFREIRGQDTTPDGSALWIRANDTPPPGFFWKVLMIASEGALINSPIMDQSPVSGFFIQDWNANREVIGEQNNVTGAWPGVPLYKRGDAIPFSCQCPPSAANPSAVAGTPNFFYTAVALVNGGIVVPPGRTVVFIGESNPGAAEPGPGIGSTGNMVIYVLQIPTTLDLSVVGSI
jgi:hypothetical protein